MPKKNPCASCLNSSKARGSIKRVYRSPSESSMPRGAALSRRLNKRGNALPPAGALSNPTGLENPRTAGTRGLQHFRLGAFVQLGFVNGLQNELGADFSVDRVEQGCALCLEVGPLTART